MVQLNWFMSFKSQRGYTPLNCPNFYLLTRTFCRCHNDLSGVGSFFIFPRLSCNFQYAELTSMVSSKISSYKFLLSVLSVCLWLELILSVVVLYQGPLSAHQERRSDFCSLYLFFSLCAVPPTPGLASNHKMFTSVFKCWDWRRRRRWWWWWRCCVEAERRKWERQSCVITGETETRLAALRAPWPAVSDLACPPTLPRPAATNHHQHWPGHTGSQTPLLTTSLLHSHWFRIIQAWLSLVEIRVLLHQLSYAIKNQLKAPKAPY